MSVRTSRMCLSCTLQFFTSVNSVLSGAMGVPNERRRGMSPPYHTHLSYFSSACYH